MGTTLYALRCPIHRPYKFKRNIASFFIAKSVFYTSLRQTIHEKNARAHFQHYIHLSRFSILFPFHRKYFNTVRSREGKLLVIVFHFFFQYAENFTSIHANTLSKHVLWRGFKKFILRLRKKFIALQCFYYHCQKKKNEPEGTGYKVSAIRYRFSNHHKYVTFSSNSTIACEFVKFQKF